MTPNRSFEMAKNLLFVVCVPALLSAQQPMTIRLDKPDATHPAEWTDVVAVRELKDGRVVVLDARDQAIKLVDMKSGTAKLIGGKGNGPGEYQLPLQLYQLPGDSSAIFDMGNSGPAMVITPSGTAGGFLPGQSGRGFLDESSQTDARGRIFRSSHGYGAIGPAIERLDRASQRVDTVGYLSRKSDTCSFSLKPGPKASPAKKGAFSAAAVNGPRPFATLEQWAVAPDGRVAIVCPDPYRVVFMQPNGSRVEGPVISYARVRVGNAEKKAWMESLPQHVASMMVNRDGKVVTGYVKARPTAAPQEWPEFLPPFVTGRHLNGAAFFAPDGMLWVTRSVAATAQPTYDVIDR